MEADRTPKLSTLGDMVDTLQAAGRYTFDRDEALALLRVSRLTLKRAAMRLVAKNRIAAPVRGFYVIVPLEYRTPGAPPPSWYVDDLMRHLGKPYYVGVLSAASLHGAGHQQSQEFQVVTVAARRPLTAGRARVRFLGKRHCERTSTTGVKTETGTMRVSTPEATALDLLRYAPAAGGLSNVATVLTELAERFDPKSLCKAARAIGELAEAQRLGHILDFVNAGDRVEDLARLIAEARPRTTPLRPGRPTRGYPVDRRWRVVVNERIEVDL